MGTLAFRRNTGQLVPSEANPVAWVSPSGARGPGAITITTPFSVTVASVGTPATIWVPSAGTRFRVLGYTVTPSATDTVFIRAVASSAFQLTIRGLANQNIQSPEVLGYFGIACATNNMALVVDAATAATALTGTIFGTIDTNLNG